MQKNCKKCNLNFEITNSDLEFYKKISPKFNGKVFEIPEPKLCPECRQQRRLAFRNERKLYKRKCDATGENIISMYSPDKNFRVYNSDFWWSDKWDVLKYGMDFDFGKSFFEQFLKLDLLIPKRPIINDNNNGSENCEYTNDFANGKNCYMCFETGGAENCIYCHHCNSSINVLDSDEVFNSENCYECIDSLELFNCNFLQESSKCSNCFYGFGLTSCDNCFACTNLKNNSYCILNKQYSKEEYKDKINNKDEILLEYKKLFNNTVRKNILLKSSENCIGNNINYSSNVNGYNIINSKDSKFCINSDQIVDCYDLQCWKSELCYEGITPDNGYKVCFSIWTWESKNIYYSFDCHNSSNLFGCIGLKNKSYCIFNKQYTKEEYNKLVPKIIEKMKTDGEWGEFFPANLSPFGYNETVAQEYFPLNKEEIINQNFNYSEYEAPFPKVEKIIQAKKLPENISDIPDDILNWAIECEISKKPFRIIKQELDFYRKHNLPIPHKHPDVRHFERMKLRNPRKLFDRKCDKCGVEMKSTYSADRDEIVYCEGCYEKEVY